MKRLVLVLSLVAATLVVHPSPAEAKWTENQSPDVQQEWSLESANACAEVFFIGARGSGQNGDAAGPLNMGDQVERLYRLFAERIHDQPISGSKRLARSAPVGVDYPALGAFSILGPYFESVDEGSQDLQAKLDAITARCGKKTRFVLAGFSQGAHAVTQALSEMAPNDRIDAVVLVASPVFRQGEAGTEYGDPPAASDGIFRGFSELPVPGWIADRTIALCKPLDTVCTSSFGFGHASYGDSILGMAADDAFDWTADDVTAVPRCDGDRASHVGTAGRDRIRGTAGGDVVYPRGGRDNIKTFAGNDKICAHGGADVITAGSGRDRVWAGGGGDTVSGGGGADVIRGGTGDDALSGQGGDDVLKGQGGTDSCIGGPGNDTISSSCESSD